MAISDSSSTHLSDGDSHREAAIVAIEHADYRLADKELRKALETHRGDPDRQAAIDMVEGRLAYALGHYAQALVFQNRADAAWVRLISHDYGTIANRQWLLDNRYYRLRTSVMTRDSFIKGSPQDDYRYVTFRSESRRQRIGARFAWFGLKWGVRFFDKFIEPRLTARPFA